MRVVRLTPAGCVASPIAPEHRHGRVRQDRCGAAARGVHHHSRRRASPVESGVKVSRHRHFDCASGVGGPRPRRAPVRYSSDPSPPGPGRRQHRANIPVRMSPDASGSPSARAAPAPELLERLTKTQQTFLGVRPVDNNPYANVCTVDCKLVLVVAVRPARRSQLPRPPSGIGTGGARR
jgi:hypothetical protein